MGVSVLQIYPAQPDKTGPQIIDTLTRRIMNLGKGTGPREILSSTYSEMDILKKIFQSVLLHKEQCSGAVPPVRRLRFPIYYK